MIWFCYFRKKNVLKKIKVVVVLGQNLGQIRSNVVKKKKEMGIIISFFFRILLREYLLKQDLVVVKPPE